MQPEPAEDAADAAFINQRVALHDCLRLSGDDIRLVGKGNLGIRNDGGRKKGMGMSALAAYHPADVEDTKRAILSEGTVIVTVHRQAGAVPAAWAGELVELEGMDDIIIKILRDRVA